MSAASRQKNVHAVTEPPQDPERWRDIQANVRKMDDLYDATFYTWLRSEDNVLVTASYLQRLAGDYDLERIEHALCWLVADWRLESIAILLRQVTFDWAQKGEQGEKDRARLVLSITENWAIQYVARLVCALLSNASMPLYVSPAISQDSFTQLQAFQSPHPQQQAFTPLGHSPVASPHTPLATSPILLQGRRMAVGNEVAAVAAAAAAASVSAGQPLASPASASSPTTPTTGSFQYQLPQLLPALTPGSSPSPPSMSPLAPAPTTSPISASTLSSRSRTQLSSTAGGSMTLPRSARLSQRRPSPAQTSLQAVLQHDTQRYPRPSHSSTLAQFPTSPPPNSALAHVGQPAHQEPQPIVIVAPHYTSGYQPTHQRSQTSNGVVSAGVGHHDLSRHARPPASGSPIYNFTPPHPQSSSSSNVPQSFQQPLHLQPTYRGPVHGSQQRTYAITEHTPHASPSSVHTLPSPAVTPAVSQLASPITSPVSRSGTPYPSSAPKPSWSSQQSSMNTSPVFYVNKPLFMECLAKKWSFCRLSEFFQSLDAAAGITVRLKCSLLKNTALKEEDPLRRASPLPSNYPNIIKPESQSRRQEAATSSPSPSSSSTGLEQPRARANVSTCTSREQSVMLGIYDSTMEMEVDQSLARGPESGLSEASLQARDNYGDSFSTGEAQQPHRQASPSVMEEDTIMEEDTLKLECKRNNIESSLASSPRRMDDGRPVLESPHSLVPGTHAAHPRGPSSAPPTRARTVDALNGTHTSLHAHEYSSMQLDRQGQNSELRLPHSSTGTSIPITDIRASSRAPSVSAPIIIVGPDGSTVEGPDNSNDTTTTMTATGTTSHSPQEGGIRVSPTQPMGTTHRVSIHPLDPYAYSQTSMHPFSHEPETPTMMHQPCTVLQVKTESSNEQGWREPQASQQDNEHHHQQQQQQHQRGHSQHSRAQTSDAVLSNTLVRAAMASNALSTLSLSDPKGGAMDDESVSVTGASVPIVTAAAAAAASLGVAGGRRFLSHEQNMSRSLCIESNGNSHGSSSGSSVSNGNRGRRGGDSEAGNGGSNGAGGGGGGGGGGGSVFGTSRSLRRHVSPVLQQHADDNGTSSRVTTPSKRKNSLGVTTLQQQHHSVAVHDGSSSSSSSVSVSRCSNLFSTFSLTSSPGSLSAGFSPSPPPSSSPSPTSACTGGGSAMGGGHGHGHGTGTGAHFFLTSNSTTQSLPGTRRTSTCTSTTDEDLKRVRCSRPGSISDSDAASTLSTLACGTTTATAGSTGVRGSLLQQQPPPSSPLAPATGTTPSLLTLVPTSSSHNTNASNGLPVSSTAARF